MRPSTTPSAKPSTTQSARQGNIVVIILKEENDFYYSKNNLSSIWKCCQTNSPVNKMQRIWHKDGAKDGRTGGLKIGIILSEGRHWLLRCSASKIPNSLINVQVRKVRTDTQWGRTLVVGYWENHLTTDHYPGTRQCTKRCVTSPRLTATELPPPPPLTPTERLPPIRSKTQVG